MRLLVSSLSNRPVSPKFKLMMFNLGLYIGAYGGKIGITECTPHMPDTISHLPYGRQEVIKRAREEGYDLVFNIDDDMLCPIDIIQSLLSYDVGVIGVNYVKKNPQLEFTAIGLDNKRIDSRGKIGIEQVACVGFGIILIRMNAIKDVPSPLFWNVMKDGDPIINGGEDAAFCKKLMDHKIPIYIDHDLTNKIGHIGEMIYSSNLYK